MELRLEEMLDGIENPRERISLDSIDFEELAKGLTIRAERKKVCRSVMNGGRRFIHIIYDEAGTPMRFNSLYNIFHGR